MPGGKAHLLDIPRQHANRGKAHHQTGNSEAIDSYEVIESYPEDKYLPSYLLLGSCAGSDFHTLFAADIDGNNVRIVTAYRPDPAEWEADLRTRRNPQ